MQYEKKMEEKLDYSSDPQGSVIEGFPEFITLLEDGNYRIEMRKIKGIDNNFDYIILEDMKNSKLKMLIDRSKNSKGDVSAEKLDELLVENAILYPKLTKDQIDDMKASEIFRLKKAINTVYDTESFL